MSLFLDTSILVAALVEDEPAHEACLSLLRRKSAMAWSHSLAESYSTLTGGRLGIRVAPAVAAKLIEASLLPRLSWLELNAAEIMGALKLADATGVRGGACHDYLHLVAARKANAKALYTLNTRHFIALARADDPPIKTP